MFSSASVEWFAVFLIFTLFVMLSSVIGLSLVVEFLAE